MTTSSPTCNVVLPPPVTFIFLSYLISHFCSTSSFASSYLVLRLLPEEARIMINKPGLLCTVEEKDQQEELLQLEAFDGCFIPWPVAVRHGGVGICCSYVWVIQEPGKGRQWNEIMESTNLGRAPCSYIKPYF